MNWNEKLDKALKLISEYSGAVNPLREIGQECQCKSHSEATRILDTLIDDGFIKSIMPSHGKYAVVVTGAGIEFLANGGYTARTERQKKEKELFEINFKKLKIEAKLGLWGFSISILAILLTLYQTFFK